MRMCIIGGPQSGKSTLSTKYNIPVFCADPISLVKNKVKGVTYLPNMRWEDQSEYICKNWFSMGGDWIIEGVGVIRALRKWLNYSDTPPCDNILFIRNSHPSINELLSGQKAMYKSIDSVWLEIYKNYAPITNYKYWK